MRTSLSLVALFPIFVLSAGCGTVAPQGWSCENDNTYLLATSRNGESGVLLGCQDRWTCDDHTYKLKCERAEDQWLCACERDGFSAGSFLNADICDIAGRTPSADDDIKAWDRQIRTRINQGCLWELPLRD